MGRERDGRRTPERWSAEPIGAVEAPADRLAARPAATTTIMFTDLVGSTDLLSRMGEDDGAAVHLTHLSELRRILARYGGREVKSVGDGLMAAFPSALSAVECAVAMQQANRRRGTQSHPTLGLRVGINSGEVILDDSQDVYGRSVVIASRLCARAQGNQILVSTVVADLVGTRGGHSFAALGGLVLKGITAPVGAAEVRWDSAVVVGPDPHAAKPIPPLPLPATLRQYANRPIVGRHDALAQLLSHLDRATAHHRRLFLLSGEPGIGKTRLAAELARIAHERGATVLFGYCEEEALVPFAPFVTALDYLAASVAPGMLHRGLAGRERELARLLPSLHQGGSGAGADGSEAAEFERYRLFEAVVALLELAANASPVVLLLDDLQWSDRESLLLLKHVMRAPRQSRLLVLATYRDEEVTPSHPLTQLLADLRRESLWERVRLGGLDPAAVQELVADAVGSHVPPEFARALWQETEGHPFFVHELLRHLLDTGTLSSRHGRFAIARAIERIGLPEGVREVVAGRLRRLGADAQDVLRVAAVIGREFPAETLEQVTGSTPAQLHALLDPAVDGQLIEPLAQSEGRYAFSHSLVRDALYQGLAPFARAELHIRVGEALERSPDRAIGEGHLAELAHHFLAGGQRGAHYASGIDYAVSAAEQAALALAFGKACGHLRRAIEALEDRSDDPRRCELLLRLGENEWQAGEYLRSRETLRRAAALAERLQLPEQLARAAIGIGSRTMQATAPDPELSALLERAMQMLAEEPTPLRTKVAGRLAMALSRQPERQRRLGEGALAEARAHGDEGLLVEVLFFAGWAMWSPDNLSERLRIADEIVELAERTGSSSLQVESHFWRIAHLLEDGQIARAELDFAALPRLAEEARQPYHLWLVAVVRAMRAISGGLGETTNELIWDAFRSGEAAQNSAAMEGLSAQLLVAYGLAGRTEEFLAAARSMTEHFQTISVYHAGLALTYCQLERWRDAQPLFDLLARDGFRGVPRDWQWLSTMDMLCEICWMLGDKERAAALQALVEPFAERHVVLGAWGASRGSVARGVGLLALVQGHHDAAVRWLGEAVESNDRLAARPAKVVAQLDLTRALIARGDPDDTPRIDALLAQVRERGTELGVHAAVAGAEAIARGLGGGGGTAAAAPTPRALRDRASELGDVARSVLSIHGRSLMARGVSHLTDEQLERRFDHPLAQRALFTAMAGSYQSRLALGFEGELGFELYSSESDSSRWWTLRVQGERVSARRRPSRDPALAMHLGVADFVRLVMGEHNPVSLWIEQKVFTEGDILLAARLVDMFGGVSLLDTLVGTEPMSAGR